MKGPIPSPVIFAFTLIYSDYVTCVFFFGHTNDHDVCIKVTRTTILCGHGEWCVKGRNTVVPPPPFPSFRLFPSASSLSQEDLSDTQACDPSGGGGGISIYWFSIIIQSN